MLNLPLPDADLRERFERHFACIHEQRVGLGDCDTLQDAALVDARAAALALVREIEQARGNEVAALRADKAELLEAVRLTNEYSLLPDLDGWSWWDAYKKHATSEALAEMKRYCDAKSVTTPLPAPPTENGGQ